MAPNDEKKIDTGWTSKDTQIFYAKKYRQVLASAPAAALAVVIGSPLENLKVRMQSHNFTNGWQATTSTYRTEGLRGFWAGTLPPLLSVTASRALGFSVYRKAKYYLDAWIERATGTSPLQHVNKPGTYPNPYTIACFTISGMVSGAAVAVAMTPFELIKNSTQSSVLMAAARADHVSSSTNSSIANKSGRVSSIECMKRIVARKGVLGLYTGFRLHLARDAIGSGIFFGVYEATKQSMNSYYGSATANSPRSIAIAGAICGIGAWVFTYPLDTMKTRVQNNLVSTPAAATTAKSTITTAMAGAAKAAAASGSKWKGVEMIILRSCLQNMLQMSLFEQAKVWIDELEFSNGSRTLPEVEREFGRDSKINKNKKL